MDALHCGQRKALGGRGERSVEEDRLYGLKPSEGAFPAASVLTDRNHREYQFYQKVLASLLTR